MECDVAELQAAPGSVDRSSLTEPCCGSVNSSCVPSLTLCPSLGREKRMVIEDAKSDSKGISVLMLEQQQTYIECITHGKASHWQSQSLADGYIQQCCYSTMTCAGTSNQVSVSLLSPVFSLAFFPLHVTFATCSYFSLSG